jgi:hypothetical protein
MQYIILSILMLITLPAFAEECKRDINIEIYNSGTKIDENLFKIRSKGYIELKRKEIYSFPVLYIKGELYTVDMLKVDNLTSNLITEHGDILSLNTTVLNRDGLVVTDNAEYNSIYFHESQNIFTYNIYVKIDENCTMYFDTNFQVSKYIRKDGEYIVVKDSVSATL